MLDAEAVIAIVAISLMCIFVAPLWIIFHYRAKRVQSRGLSEQDAGMIEELWYKSEKMAERIETLEAILDDETPGWRKRL